MLHSIRKIHFSRSETELKSQIQQFKIRFKKNIPDVVEYMSKQWFQKPFSNWQIFHRPPGCQLLIILFFWLCVQKTLYFCFLVVCAKDIIFSFFGCACKRRILVFIRYSKKIIKVMCTSENLL